MGFNALQLRYVQKLLKQEQAVGVRCFSDGSLTSTYKRNERHCSYTPATYSTVSTTATSNGIANGETARRIRTSMPLLVLGKESFPSCLVLRRWLSSDSSEFMMVLIFIPKGDTDKATVEMECIEEGYLAIILKGDGSKESKVGEASALALRKIPQCNSSWTDEYIRQFHNININVAVQTDNGLFVPAVKDADKKGLSKISEEIKNLAQKAKDNSLKPEDYEGGTFTVSNLGGPFGIKQFCAIINPPHSGILAVGSAEKRVVPGSVPGEYKFASFMTVTLSCDHHVIDGAVGAEWWKAFKGYIENPEFMLL